jgi:hypothetical protein
MAWVVAEWLTETAGTCYVLPALPDRHQKRQGAFDKIAFDPCVKDVESFIRHAHRKSQGRDPESGPPTLTEIPILHFS